MEPAPRRRQPLRSQLQRFVDVFGRDALCVILYDDLVADPVGTYAGICRKPRTCSVRGFRRARCRARARGQMNQSTSKPFAEGTSIPPSCGGASS